MLRLALLPLLAAALPLAAQQLPRPSGPLAISMPNSAPLDVARFKGKVIAVYFLNPG